MNQIRVRFARLRRRRILPARAARSRNRGAASRQYRFGLVIGREGFVGDVKFPVDFRTRHRYWQPAGHAEQRQA